MFKSLSWLPDEDTPRGSVCVRKAEGVGAERAR